MFNWLSNEASEESQIQLADVWKARRSCFIFQVHLAVCLKSFFVWQMPLAGLRTPFVPFQISFFRIENVDLHFAFFTLRFFTLRFSLCIFHFTFFPTDFVNFASENLKMSKSNLQKRKCQSQIISCALRKP